MIPLNKKRFMNKKKNYTKKMHCKNCGIWMWTKCMRCKCLVCQFCGKRIENKCVECYYNKNKQP